MRHLLAVLLTATPLAAQTWPSQVTNTPLLVQDGFGVGGRGLPNDGLDYCIPTSTTMSLLYLGNAGFTGLAPGNATPAQQLNYDLVLAGLMNTSPIGGTVGDGKAEGLALLFAARGLGVATTSSSTGFSNANFTYTKLSTPSMATIASFYEPPLQTGQISIAQIAIGWFASTDGTNYTRTGGHGISILGTQGADTIIVNNPEPRSLARVPDLPAFVTQYATTAPFVGVLPPGTGNPLRITSTQHGPASIPDHQALIQGVELITINVNQLAANNPVAQTWTIDGVKTFNTNGGSIDAIAPLADGTSAGGITKTGAGTLTLSCPVNATTTGQFSVNGGTLLATSPNATPLGTGVVKITSGSLTLSPTGAATPTLAAGSAGVIVYAGGGTLTLAPATLQPLVVTYGGNTGGGFANLQREGRGTLVIDAALGGSTILQSAGSGTNLPPLTNGIVHPALVGQTSGVGDFLTYQPVTGFGTASYNFAPINDPSVTATTVYAATTPQTIAASGTVNVYAIKSNVLISGAGDTTTLAVGPQTAGSAGVVLNGGTIAASVLKFGAAEAAIYTGSAGGTISSQIQGSGGLTVFGPGTLTLGGASTYTGTTIVQSGTLSVTGSITSPVTVSTAATLRVGGTTGAITALDDGTIVVAGGTIASASVDIYSTLSGTGTVTGAVTVHGNITAGAAPGTLELGGPVTFAGNTIVTIKLFELADNTSPTRPWNKLALTGPGSGLTLGTSGMHNDFHFGLDFSAVDDPNSGNVFWNESHAWTILTSANAPTATPFAALAAPGFVQGGFKLEHNTDYSTYTIVYTPVPEPAFVLLIVTCIGCVGARRLLAWTSAKLLRIIRCQSPLAAHSPRRLKGRRPVTSPSGGGRPLLRRTRHTRRGAGACGRRRGSGAGRRSP